MTKPGQPAPAKILFVSHTAGISGAEECLLTLVKYVDKSRFEPIVVMPADGPLRREMEASGVRVLILPLRWWATAPSSNRLREAAIGAYRALISLLGIPPRFALAVRAYRTVMGLLHAPADGRINHDLQQRVLNIEQLIRHENIALVHSNTSVIWEGAFAASRAGVPHIWHLHEILKGYPRLAMLLPLEHVYTVFGTLSQRVVTVSDAVRNAVPSGVPRDKYVTIANGIDSDKLEGATARNLRAELHLSANAIIVLAVGTLNAAKGYDYLLQAMTRVRQQNKNIHLLVAGGGSVEEIADFSRMIEDLGLRDVVHPLGYRRDVPVLLQNVDFLVLSSVTESFSLAIVEAMAVGKPVVATACGGPSEIVVEGRTGFLVPIRDEKSLANKIIKMAADENARIKMGQNARIRFEEKYRADVFAAQFATLYEEAIARYQSCAAAEIEESKNLTSTLINVYPHLSQDELSSLQKSLLWKTTRRLRKPSSQHYG